MKPIQTAKEIGDFGETKAVHYLRWRGYTVKERNYRAGHHEIDIIAANFTTIAFVEVKTRESVSYGTPAEAVDKNKQQRYRMIAKFYWMKTKEEPNARFDVAEVYGDGRIEYIKYAY